MSKYFVVDDIKVASVMATLLNEDYYKYYNAQKGHDVYTFIRTYNINKIYGHAMAIVNNL